MQPPQRPYVPHRTPSREQPAVSFSDFALGKPFVPGTGIASDSALATEIAATTREDEAALRPIQSSPIAPRRLEIPGTADVADEESSEETEELPPLEHFLDPLPPITEFSAELEASEPAATYSGAAPDLPDSATSSESASSESDSGWVETDWQQYDWKSVAALGETERSQAEASNAWATTDWEVPRPKSAEPGRGAADAIATALDQIAERIRNGDLSLPGPGAVTDPATLAATVAALLGVRR